MLRLSGRPRFAQLTAPASVFVVLYVVMLFCIPSQLIVRPIGSPGTPANLVGLFALVWWSVSTLGGQNPRRGATALRITLGLMAAAVIISYAVGMASGWYAPVDIHGSTDELWTLIQVQPGDLSAKMMSAANRGLLTFGGWAGIALLTAEGLTSRADLDRVLTWMAWCGAGVASLGIVQYFTGLDIASFFTIPGLSANSEFGGVDSRSILNRVSSTAVHPIEFAVLMAAVFFLALHRALFSPFRRDWLPVLLIGMALPMAVSRSGILAIAAGLMVMLLGWPKKWRFWGIVALPFAVVAIRLMAPGLVGTIRSLFLNLLNDPSISGRTSDYASVFSLYADHPILGRGLFTFVPRYYRILDNQMLMTLVELGIVGLLALLILLAGGIYTAGMARKSAPDEKARHLSLAIQSALLGVVVSYLTFDALGFPMVAGITFLLLGMAGATFRINSVSSWPVKKSSSRTTQTNMVAS